MSAELKAKRNHLTEPGVIFGCHDGRMQEDGRSYVICTWREDNKDIDTQHSTAHSLNISLPSPSQQ
ncbi:mCG148416 [Mus musculus]|nr:mCG148416 [Mus musculus]